MRLRATRVVPLPLLRVLLVVVLSCAGAAVAAVEPVYWRQRVFFIPYQAAPDALAAEKVQLLISRDGVGEWAVLQEAEPHVRGFSYHAPTDGDYSFAVRMVDKKGNVSPTVIAQPSIRIVVDTAPPSLQLAATMDATGRVVLRYEARDLQLKPETLRLEAQTNGGPWERLAAGPPDVSQPDRMVGQVAWKPPTSAAKVVFRASIDDRATNQFAATTEASLIGGQASSLNAPLNGGPAMTGPSLSPAMAGPLLSPSAPLTEAPSLIPPVAEASRPRAGVDWPTNTDAAPLANSGVSGTTPTPSGLLATQSQPPAPPLWPTQRTPAQLVADSPNLKPSAAGASTAINPFVPPPLLNSSPASSNPPAEPVALPAIGGTANGANSGWTAPATSDASPPIGPGETRWVNSLTFDVDYDIQSVGPWGVSRIELWATNDGGQTWANFGVDDDNRSPMRVTMPASGVYGFRLVVSGANGAAAPAPQAGEKPELTIGVDLEEPQCELLAAELGQGPLADHLVIRWTASDANVDGRPVGLFYGAAAEGPWSTIATDIDNNGQYAWRLLRQVPENLFLRLEVRDKAGNVSVRMSPAPVVLNLPQPTGRLRSVRPVQEEPARFRTANGAGAQTGVQ